jgi:predicted AlkP superfamily phosphohydrolase/phosphomutase
MNRIIIIGLDGATFDLIKPWVSQGKLPNMQKLLESGTYGELRSVTPPMSPPAWTSFMTGKNQGKHGIFDFTERVPNSYSIRFINSSKRRAKTIWKMMSEAGKRVAVIGVPFTYPPEEINGVMISGFDSPGTGGGTADKSSMYPAELYYEILNNVGNYYIASNLLGANNDESRLEEVLKTLQRKIETATYLLNKERWDCFAFVIGETDAIAHYFWKYFDPFSPLADSSQNNELKNAILKVYKEADDFLGTLFTHLDADTNLFVMSDHGHGGYSNTAIHLNRWLEKEGFLKFEKRGIINSAYQNANRSTLNIAKKFGVALPSSIKKLIISKTRIGGKFESALRFSGICWEETSAFAEETPYYPMIWINMKGREPVGIVSGNEYNKVRDKIIQRLYDFKNPETGECVVARVFKREEIYSGDYVDKAPDLVIDWNLDKGYTYHSRSSLDSKVKLPIAKIEPMVAKGLKSGSHRDYGIFMAFGNNMKNNNIISGARLIDIAPTLLYLSGLPVSSDMDGKVLTQIFNEEYISSHPVQYIDASGQGANLAEVQMDYSLEEEKTIKERLQGLGYIE